MYQGKRILGVIPARGGSRRVPRKNIRPLAGAPLIAYAIESAAASPALDRVIVSTDDSEIAEVARSRGADVPFLRPAELARDNTPDGPVFSHALEFLERSGEAYDYVLNLRPTTPFRTAEDIGRIVAIAAEGNFDVVRSVTASEAEHHPYWMYRGDGAVLTPLIRGKSIKTYYQRQLLPAGFYALNAVVDLVSRRQIARAGAVYQAARTGYIEIPKERSWDINDEIDFAVAEAIANSLKHHG